MFNRVNNRGGGNAANNTNKPVCQFFLRGTCKFGDACHNYHPPQNANRGPLPYMLNSDSVRSDLTDGDNKPIWPLSAYGPGRDAPRQLMEGAIEQSPDELRVQYYLAKANGNTQQYEASERAALQQADNQVRQILSDVDGAIKYVMDGKDQHPNRLDMTTTPTTQWRPQTNAIQGSTATGSAFGQPSALAAPSTGGSAFGRPSMPGATSAFGQPSGLGGQPAFGQPSAAPSAFGQPSTTGTTSAFGKPSTLGSGFGQPSALGGGGGGGSGFGQPSALGGSSAFGKPSALGGGGGGSAFGQPSSLGGTGAGASPFATASNTNTASGFGQPSNLGGNTGAFGKPSPFGAQPNTAAPANPSPFGASASQAPATTNAPGQPGPPFQSAPQPNQAFNNAPRASPFGQNQGSNTNGTAFGQPTAPSNPFSNNNANKPSPFGASAANGPTQPAAPAQQQQQQQSGPITSFKGRPIEYLRLTPDDPTDQTTAPFYLNSRGRKERIWMPQGAPGPNPDVEAPEDAYQGEVGALLKQVYDFAQQSDVGFKDGFVPEIPPKREWVSFEL